MSTFDPYKPPQFIEPKSDYGAGYGPKPQVVFWYRVYCSAMLLLGVLYLVGGIALLILAPQLEMKGDDRAGLMIQGLVFTVMSVPIMLFNLVGILIPRKRWGWIYGIVAIAFGLTSPCCLPATIPLLIFWIKPETKSYFGA